MREFRKYDDGQVEVIVNGQVVYTAVSYNKSLKRRTARAMKKAHNWVRSNRPAKLHI